MEQQGQQIETAGVVAVIGGAACAVGTLLPWAKASGPFNNLTASGLDFANDQGKYVLILGAAIALFAALGLVRRPVSDVMLVLVILVAGGAVGLTIYNLSDVSNRATDFNGASDIVHIDIGFGLYVSVVGAAVGLIGALLSIQNRQARPEPVVRGDGPIA